MSVPAVLNALFQIPDFLSAKSSANKFKQEFQQLGQDLQSGNLANAQPAYVSLQQECAQLRLRPKHVLHLNFLRFKQRPERHGVTNLECGG